jgi:ABC-type uncharacterized transport system auxiliary subunit
MVRREQGAPMSRARTARKAHRASLGAGLAACAILAAGCGGSGGDIPEARTYRIGFFPASAAAGNALPVTLGVAAVRGSETYRQERLVYRTQPNRVGFYPYDRWEVPPVEMVTEAIIAHLRASGGFLRVVPYTRDGRVDYVLRGRLLRFDEEDAGAGAPWSAVVEIDYELVDPQRSQVVATGAARATQAVPQRSAEAIVGALSAASRDALDSLAAQVKGAIPAARP